MIAPYFPPRARVGARRPFHFARYLPAFGVEPLVVSLPSALTPHRDDRAALAQIDQFALLAPFDRTEGSARGGAPSFLDAHVPVDTWWPLLVAQAGRVVRRARAFQPEVIWSTADPWSSHALAMRVARALDVPWLADFRDPWSLCQVRGRERPPWVRAIDARAEASYVHAATLCTFTSERTTERYRRAYPLRAGHFHTIENSFDAEAYGRLLPARIEPHAVDPEPALSLTFFGRFRALSSAARAIEVLSRARALDPQLRVRVRCLHGLDATDRGRAEQAGVRAMFEPFAAQHGAAALDLLTGSDILLLSSEPGRDEIIPAKLYDYLAAARPVLSLCEGPDVAAILARTGAGVQLEQTEAAARLLVTCARAKRAGQPLPIASSLAVDARATFSAQATTARLAALLACGRGTPSARPCYQAGRA